MNPPEKTLDSFQQPAGPPHSEFRNSSNKTQQLFEAYFI